MTELTAEDVVLIRETLRELPSVAENIVSANHERPSVVGSLAHDYFVRGVKLHSESGLELVRHALGGSHITVLAASDHVKALVSAFNNGSVSVATATLTRGVIEALGKAHLLLSGGTAEQLVQNYVALVRSEMEQAIKYNEFRSYRGDDVNGANHLSKIRSLLSDMGLLEIGTVQLTAVATAVITAGGGSDKSRQIYSQLSSVAHSESAGVSMFLQDTVKGPRLDLSRDIALDYVAMIATVFQTVVDRLVFVYQPEAEHLRRWDSAKERSNAALSRLVHG